MTDPFIIAPPQFDPGTGEATFSYNLGPLTFTERLAFPRDGLKADIVDHPAFSGLLALTAAVLGVSYYKLKAPYSIDVSNLLLPTGGADFLLDVYENGLGEFFARNDLSRFGKLAFTGETTAPTTPLSPLGDRALVLVGGGKDSLVSVDLLERAETPMTLFAVNPKGPILSSVARAEHDFLAVRRTLDPEMIRLGNAPGYYNGHVPSTAINSMIASLAALLYGYNAIVLSNERSASEGNLVFDGREANHQYSKSLAFEGRIRAMLASVTGGALDYFSLLRPYSEARIARLFARTTRFDDVFSSCNRNFRLSGHDGPLWCGECPKCHFVFLIFAPHMERARLEAIFGRNVLDNPDNIPAYRELTGLAGHKPWECVGEILEAAACLWKISDHPDWRDTAVVSALRDDLAAFYGADRLVSGYKEAMTDSAEHMIPAHIFDSVAPHAH